MLGYDAPTSSALIACVISSNIDDSSVVCVACERSIRGQNEHSVLGGNENLPCGEISLVVVSVLIVFATLVLNNGISLPILHAPHPRVMKVFIIMRGGTAKWNARLTAFLWLDALAVATISADVGKTEYDLCNLA
jgi:hypothetical protein